MGVQALRGGRSHRGQEMAVEERADHLKERVYLTFTALAVVLALRGHVDTAAEAATTLVIAVVGTLLAVFVADVVSHIAVHAAVPERRELRHMFTVSLGALSAVVVPFACLGLTGLGLWELDTALLAGAVTLVLALVAIGYIAVRRLHLPLVQRLVVLLAEFFLGSLVVALELLAHG